jgi:PTH1 family peptidyl-tRNA hydrolase
MNWDKLGNLLSPKGEGRFIIICLGNPGPKYRGTRHNAGFEVADRLGKAHGIEIAKAKRKSVLGEGVIAGRKVVVAKPQTYMNLSGDAVVELVGFYKAELLDIVIVCDDVSLPPGEVRIRKKGSAGGHNGLKSVIERLGTDEFARVKIGIGEKPSGWDLADYVLGSFGKDELEIMAIGLDKGAAAVEAMLSKGIDNAMNLYNRKVETAKEKEAREKKEKDKLEKDKLNKEDQKKEKGPEAKALGEDKT